MCCFISNTRELCFNLFNVPQKKDQSDVSSELSHFSGLNSSKVQPLQVPTNRQQDLQPSASGSDTSVEPVPKTLSFTEQLAAKLGNIIKEKDDPLKDSEINRRPIQKQPSDYGALFSNEPPPLDTQESHGIFSDGKGLFDDEDEEDLWKPGDNKISSIKTVSSSDSKQGTFGAPGQGKGLFDDDSDDDIFSSTKNNLATQQMKTPFLQSSKPLLPVFNEEPPLLEEEKNVKEKKKPAGGVSLFGESDIFRSPAVGKILKQRRISSSEDEDEPKLNQEEKKSSIDEVASRENDNFLQNKNTLKQQTVSSVPQSVEPEKGKSLFDDDIFRDDLFSSIEKRNSTGLFEKSLPFLDDDNNEPFLSRAGSTSALGSNIKTDKTKELGSNIVSSPDDTDYSFRKNSKTNISSLFDDLEDDNDNFLVTTEDKNIGRINIKKELKKSERAHEEQRIPKTAGLFDDLAAEDDLFSGLSKINDGVKSKKSMSFLFDDNEDNDFDIFQTKDNKKNLEDVKKENAANETRKNTEREVKSFADESTKPKLSLFDDDSDDMDDLFSQISKKNDAKISDNSKKTSIISESSPTGNFQSPSEKTEISKDFSHAQDEIPEKLRKPSTSDKPPIKNSPATSEIQNCENSTEDSNTSIENTLLEIESTKANDNKKMEKENEHKTVPEISINEDSETIEPDSNSTKSNKSKTSSGVLNVEFMDSIPPPDDDWETYSDNAFDDMEQVKDGFQSQPSSLFDNEPPSLFFEDSHHMSKEPINKSESKSQNVPSDIFDSGDEEEKDILGSNVNNDYNIKQRLDINAYSVKNEFPSIPTTIRKEVNKEDLSVPPTSNLENIAIISSDMESPVREYPQNQLENDTNGNKIKSKPPIDREKPVTDKKIERTGSLFSDMLDVDQTDFLFPKMKSTNDKESNSEISEDIISRDKSCKKSVSFDSSEENQIETDEPGVLPEGEDNMQKNILKITEKLQQISSKPEERTKPLAVPGKLTHNLNINVGALLPGSALPKRSQPPDHNENLSKSLPPSRYSLNEELFRKPSLPTKPISIKRVSSEDSPGSKEYCNLEKSISFDGGTDIEVLQSITKDRPRIQVKRRPSSRRARQKSLRDSISDFRLDDPIPDETLAPESDERDSVDKSVQEQKTSDTQTLVDSSGQKNKESGNVTDEIFSDIENSEDLFKSLEKEIRNVNKANIISTKSEKSKEEIEGTKNLSDSLFQDDEDDLFKSIISKEKHESGKSNLKDEISEDQTKPIFTDRSKENNEQHLGKIEKDSELNHGNKAKKTVDNLFDSSDDDDIFKSTKISIIGKTLESTLGSSSKLRTDKSGPDKLFDFSDDEDFLENFTRQKEDGKTVDKKTNVKHQNNLLFDDMDNDDIFGTNSSTKNKAKQDVKPSVINKKPPKSNSLRKLENIESEEDPLSALLK